MRFTLIKLKLHANLSATLMSSRGSTKHTLFPAWILNQLDSKAGNKVDKNYDMTFITESWVGRYRVYVQAKVILSSRIKTSRWAGRACAPQKGISIPLCLSGLWYFE